MTTRKHFYKTEVYQIQDALLAEEADVNGAIALGAACAIMQTTAARCGMLTKDNYDDKSVRWCDKNPLRVRDVRYSLVGLVVAVLMPWIVAGRRAPETPPDPGVVLSGRGRASKTGARARGAASRSALFPNISRRSA